ncbi:MAG: hypothetical protein ACOCWG_02240 [bacterium]
MELPTEFIIDNTLTVGTIYKIVADELIGTDVPHYFIIVAIDGTDNYLTLCTSQKERIENHFKNKKLNLDGLVYIKPDKANGLKIDTYVNCNDYYLLSKDKLVSKLESRNLQYIGQLSLNHYAQIKTGIINSYINDIPHFLLVHPEE